jgi:hypothetical protein
MQKKRKRARFVFTRNKKRKMAVVQTSWKMQVLLLLSLFSPFAVLSTVAN